MTFEEWYNEYFGNTDLLSDPDIREDREDEYREAMKAEEAAVKRFGEEWLAEKREDMRGRVEEVLRYLNEDTTQPNCKHAWLFTQVGEIEYAQLLGILSERDANRYKDRLFDAWNKTLVKEAE